MKYLPNDWDAIRKHYDRFKDQIMSEPRHIFGLDPYAWDMGSGMIWMNPIERAIWCDIRNEGLVMYPQWPQCGFFLDFANPVAKVAIECDGREFHDRAKDRERDAILESIGWKIYRISGSDCIKDGSDDEEGHYQPSPGEIFCRRIARDHRISSRYADA